MPWVQVERGTPAAGGLFCQVNIETPIWQASLPTTRSSLSRVRPCSSSTQAGIEPDEAERVAKTLLPDVMPYDPTRPASFPEKKKKKKKKKKKNGRSLTDDAADAFMVVLTNGTISGDRGRSAQRPACRISMPRATA